MKGKISTTQKLLLNQLLKERRKKIWAHKKGIHWMDGMPLTLEEISSFFTSNNLKEILDDLVTKGYLRYEYPKDLITVTNINGTITKEREYRTDLPKGYNIVVGKLSFEINKILDSNDLAPTLVATDLDKIVVVDGQGLRKLTIREGLNLFGFPDNYQIDLPTKKAFDLLGNTVVVTIIKEITKCMLRQEFRLINP